MKKLILIGGLIILLSGCGFLSVKNTTEKQDNNNEQVQDSVQVKEDFDLVNYSDLIKENMSDWYDKWQAMYDNYSITDFVEKDTYEIEYYAENKYQGEKYDHIKKTGDGLPVTVVKVSPDESKLITVTYGGDPDSGVRLIDLQSRMGKSITKLHCGTTCIFTNGFWLDNYRFIVVGEGETYPNGYDQAIDSNKIHETPFIYLTDLAAKKIIKYEYQISLIKNTKNKNENNKNIAAVLRHKIDNNNYEIIARFNDPFTPEIYLSNNRLAVWQNYIIYVDHDNYQVISYNTQNNQKNIIMDWSNEFEKIDGLRGVSLSAIRTIGNQLFVFFGDYLTEGGLFVVDLPHGKPVLVTKAANPNLVKLNDKIFLVSGEGDACWNYTDFQSYDINNKKLGQKIELKFDCGEGNSFIGIDDDYKFISVNYKNIWESKDDTNPDSVAESVKMIDALTNESTILISEQIMPKNIDNVKYNKKTNQILLISQNNNFIFDINNNNLIETNNQDIINDSDFKIYLETKVIDSTNKNLPEDFELVEYTKD